MYVHIYLRVLFFWEAFAAGTKRGLVGVSEGGYNIKVNKIAIIMVLKIVEILGAFLQISIFMS